MKHNLLCRQISSEKLFVLFSPICHKHQLYCFFFFFVFVDIMAEFVSNLVGNPKSMVVEWIACWYEHINTKSTQTIENEISTHVRDCCIDLCEFNCMAKNACNKCTSRWRARKSDTREYSSKANGKVVIKSRHPCSITSFSGKGRINGLLWIFFLPFFVGFSVRQSNVRISGIPGAFQVRLYYPLHSRISFSSSELLTAVWWARSSA